MGRLIEWGARAELGGLNRFAIGWLGFAGGLAGVEIASAVRSALPVRSKVLTFCETAFGCEAGLVLLESCWEFWSWWGMDGSYIEKSLFLLNKSEMAPSLLSIFLRSLRVTHRKSLASSGSSFGSSLVLT